MLLIPVKVAPSAIHNLGVFAVSPIRKGTIVWQFDPGIDHRHPVAWLSRQPDHVRRHALTYGVLNLAGTHYNLPGDHTMFVNHSESPNLAPDDDVQLNGDGVVVAARDIAAGEEITIHYGEIDGADRDRLRRGQPLFPQD